MRVRGWLRLKLIGLLLVGTLAFGQADQPTTATQPTPQQPSGQPPTAQPPATPRPIKPQSVVDAARASKQAQESASPAKVYRNKDLKDPTDVSSATGDHSAAATPATPPAAAEGASPTADETLLQKDKDFEAQGETLQKQVRLQREKIVAIQNNIQHLQAQFADWSTWYYPYDGNVSLCWTSQGDTTYYKSYCDQGKSFKSQSEAAQRQLAQEKARLRQMQEDIRRKGYGNSVYDPD